MSTTEDDTTFVVISNDLVILLSLEQFQLADEALFQLVQNDDRHVLRSLMSPMTEYSYNLRRRLHDYKLIKKTSTLNSIIFSYECCIKTVFDIIWYLCSPILNNPHHL